jgi:uncharacterized protein involved in exopolysaccharide biosynthesis
MVIRLQPQSAPHSPAADQPPARRAGERARLVSRLAAVLRAWLPITLAFALPLLLAFTGLKLAPVSYTATASVFADGDLGGAANGDARRSHLDLATSRSVLDRVAVRGDLAEDIAALAQPGIGAAFTELLARIRGEPASGNASQRPARLAAALKATPSEQANVIDLTVRSTMPSSAARLANAVAEAFVEDVAALGRAGPRPAGSRGDDLRRRLRDAEAALAAQASPAVAADINRSAGLKARIDRIEQLLAAGSAPDAIADQLGSPGVERLKARYLEAKAQETSLTASLGARHPSAVAARQHAEETAKLLSEAIRLAVTALRTELAEVPQQATAGAAQDEARRAVERARTEYEAYLKTPEGLAESRAARIVRPALAPALVNGNRERLIWLAALTASGLLSLLVAVRAYRRAPAHAAEPVTPRRRQSDRRASARAAAATAAAPSPAERLPETEAVVRAAAMPVATLAAEVSDRGWQQALQTLLLLGADREAVAATALDLASDLARRHLRVLLLDADEPRAYLSRKLGQAPVAGCVVLNQQRRTLVSLLGDRGEAIWLAPALSSLDSAAPPDGGLVVPGLAGHFDVLLMVGPEAENAANLAAAADRVLVASGPGASPSGPSLARTLGIAAEKVQFLRRPAAQGRSGNLIRLDLAR